MDPCSDVSRWPFSQMTGTTLPRPSCSQGKRRPLLQGDRKAGSSPDGTDLPGRETRSASWPSSEPAESGGAAGLGCLQPTSFLPHPVPVLWLS